MMSSTLKLDKLKPNIVSTSVLFVMVWLNNATGGGMRKDFTFHSKQSPWL